LDLDVDAQTNTLLAYWHQHQKGATVDLTAIHPLCRAVFVAIPSLQPGSSPNNCNTQRFYSSVNVAHSESDRQGSVQADECGETMQFGSHVHLNPTAEPFGNSFNSNEEDDEEEQWNGLDNLVDSTLNDSGICLEEEEDDDDTFHSCYTSTHTSEYNDDEGRGVYDAELVDALFGNAWNAPMPLADQAAMQAADLGDPTDFCKMTIKEANVVREEQEAENERSLLMDTLETHMDNTLSVWSPLCPAFLFLQLLLPC
jgi:hypothetical protein